MEAETEAQLMSVGKTLWNIGWGSSVCEFISRHFRTYLSKLQLHLHLKHVTHTLSREITRQSFTPCFASEVDLVPTKYFF